MEKIPWNSSRKKMRWNKSWKNDMELITEKKKDGTNHGKNDMELITEKRKLRWKNSEKN